MDYSKAGVSIQLSAPAILGVLLFAAFAVHSLLVWRLHRAGKGPDWSRHLVIWLTLIALVIVLVGVPLPAVIAVICVWSLIVPPGYLWLQARRRVIR
jgi:hypothetical protein